MIVMLKVMMMFTMVAMTSETIATFKVMSERKRGQCFIIPQTNINNNNKKK